MVKDFDAVVKEVVGPREVVGKIVIEFTTSAELILDEVAVKEALWELVPMIGSYLAELMTTPGEVSEELRNDITFSVGVGGEKV